MNAPHRERAIVDAEARPRLPRHVRLHFDEMRQAWALLSPEKVLWPDETSLAILRLCDGQTSVDAISHPKKRKKGHHPGPG